MAKAIQQQNLLCHDGQIQMVLNQLKIYYYFTFNQRLLFFTFLANITMLRKGNSMMKEILGQRILLFFQEKLKDL